MAYPNIAVVLAIECCDGSAYGAGANQNQDGFCPFDRSWRRPDGEGTRVFQGGRPPDRRNTISA